MESFDFVLLAGIAVIAVLAVIVAILLNQHSAAMAMLNSGVTKEIFEKALLAAPPDVFEKFTALAQTVTSAVNMANPHLAQGIKDYVTTITDGLPNLPVDDNELQALYDQRSKELEYIHKELLKREDAKKAVNHETE